MKLLMLHDQKGKKVGINLDVFNIIMMNEIKKGETSVLVFFKPKFGDRHYLPAISAKETMEEVAEQAKSLLAGKTE